MNRIHINLKCGKSVFLLDDEDLTKDKLAENLSTLFSINNVAILNTHNASLVIRPNDIASIKVEESKSSYEDSDRPEEVQPTPLKEKEPESKPEIVEDIITDID